MTLVNSVGCTPADVLEGAAGIMEEWGFVQRDFVCREGKVCEEGAVYAAAGSHVHYQVNGVWTYKSLYVGDRAPLLDEDGTVASYCGGPRWTKADSNVTYSAVSALREVGGGITHNDRSGNTFELSVAKLREAAEHARAHETK